MLALQITSMKQFMNQLLVSEDFHVFLLEEATISTANTYTIDGHINRDFYSAEEQTTENLPYEFQPWSELKGLCFNLIKGKHTPLYFKFVFHLKPEHIQNLLQKQSVEMDLSTIKAFVLTVKYDGSKAVLTTGTSYHTFVMNKEPEVIWDKALNQYLSQKGTGFEVL